MQNINAGNNLTDYYQPQYLKHVTVVFSQADMMLGLLAMQADIGFDKHNEAGVNFYRFSKDVSLVTSSPKQYIEKFINIWKIILPLTKFNDLFHKQYSVI